jgi:hypothetical protein
MYSYDKHSGCIEHPCIRYNYIGDYPDVIKSGNIKGVNFWQKTHGSAKGVKVFR